MENFNLHRSSVQSAEDWFARFKSLESSLFVKGVETKPVKIAIIDTGAVFTKQTAHNKYDDRIIDFWPTNDTNQTERKVGLDYDGHGTHVASALLSVDPFCHIYVARAFGKRGEQQGREMAEEVQHKVVSAIRHAIHQWKVDILSLSFGFERPVEDIHKAIREAADNKILVLASCGSPGGSAKWSWPARHSDVLGIYASNGDDNGYSKNPTPEEDASKFAALGVAVEVLTAAGGSCLCSSTSIATPVAAGIAGTLIHFMRQHREDYLTNVRQNPNRGWIIQPPRTMGEKYDGYVRTLSTRDGMRAIFSKMANSRNGLHVLVPTMLFQNHGEGIHLVNSILLWLRNL
ncbi:hypothetical protein LTR27_012978 [Elasticomyces elasticus]|nr:hypothetical protein LTR27_012978 [Elasticomyces elasticus]